MSMPAYSQRAQERNEKPDAKLTRVQSAINVFDRLRFPNDNNTAMKEVQDLKEQLARAHTKLHLAEDKISKLEDEKRILSARALQAESGNIDKEKRLQELERRYAQMQQLLEQRTTELDSAQAYSNKRDEHPGSTVLAMVEAINTEIFNFGTSINKLFEDNPKSTSAEVVANQAFFDRCRGLAQGCLGEQLYQYNCQIDEALILRQPITPENSLSLQLALQSVLVGWCIHVAGAFGMEPGEVAVRRIYEGIRYREEQSISARWRVIAAGAMREQEQSFMQDIKSGIMAILIIHGLSTIGPGYPEVGRRVLERMQNLEKMLLALKRVMHEGIVSGDMEVLDAEINDIYCPEAMCNAYPERRDGARTTQVAQQVFCTVALGLRKTTMNRGADGYMTLRIDMMKRPEVALVEILNELAMPELRDYK